MKNSGITRKIDSLGRIVLPKELRRTLGIEEGDPVEIWVNGEQVILQKHCPACAVCGSRDISTSCGRAVLCAECIELIAKLA